MTTQPSVATVEWPRKTPLSPWYHRVPTCLSDPNGLWLEYPAQIDSGHWSFLRDGPSLFVCVYHGAKQEDVTRVFAHDASALAEYRHESARQDWEAGRWWWPAFAAALLLAPLGVGLLMLLYMRVATHDGRLLVEYSRRDTAFDPRRRSNGSVDSPRELESNPRCQAISADGSSRVEARCQPAEVWRAAAC
jgi:hypothetical protein